MNTSLDSRLASATATLRSYHSVGREFMQIASEYTQVKAEIENKKWALRELGKVEGKGQGPHRWVELDVMAWRWLSCWVLPSVDNGCFDPLSGSNHLSEFCMVLTNSVLEIWLVPCTLNTELG